MRRSCFSTLILYTLWGASQSFVHQSTGLGSASTTHRRLDLILHDVATNEAESSASASSKQQRSSPVAALYPVATSTWLDEAPPCLTPYQLTLPQLFDLQVTGDDIKVPFDKALQLLRESLEHVARYGLNGAYSKHKILRIQHKVSHPVDPLGWLDAQRHNTESFYLNVEKDVEVALVGSALTVQSHRHMYPWLDVLPDNSRFYGASRFDDGNHTLISEEWRDFGHGVWMLPKVEVVVRGDQTVVAVHVVRRDPKLVSWQASARETLLGLERITSECTTPIPPTTLPPILSRDSSYKNGDGQEVFECAFAAALERLNDDDDSLSKVVLARQLKLHLGTKRRNWNSLQLLRRWKYGGHEGGHLFYLSCRGSEFFGCTPERLFQVTGQTVTSEALAGTRPRGSTQEEDEELFLELVSSPKDRQENTITGDYIEKNFQNLVDRGLIRWTGQTGDKRETDVGNFFVRRLLHLQHICQRYSAVVVDESLKANVTRFLLEQLHPTPAVCGFPSEQSREFIRCHEASWFDRGLYAGPVGYVGRDSSDILVAIRSGLVPSTCTCADEATTVFTYSGAGIVLGSTLQGEWAETNYKLAVISSMFPQSPMMLQGAPTANVAWATAFVEELIRNGVTQFYVCPGSRSTPLVVAVARAVRSHVGIVSAVSVHDERAAGFRALGYGRGAGRPAVVLTSSGTAVANLYPSVVEAGMDGVPVLFLTADRPYENRHTGANQAIDQVNMFSSSYIRWFRDVLPPDDKVPVSVALSDAAHAVRVCLSARGPVHINVQFRENLAPEAGTIRNDGREGAVERFNGAFFTEVPGYKRWSVTGDKWTKAYSPHQATPDSPGVLEVARLITESKRGLIVVGNLRSSPGSDEGFGGSYMHLIDAISNFAQSIGFPILAGVQAAGLRFRSSAVVPFSDHVLKCSLVNENLKPDLVLQLGAPLISTAILSAIQDTVRCSGSTVNHVLVHPLFASERVDPEFTVTHTVSSEVLPFLESLSKALRESVRDGRLSSELAPLVTLGRKVRNEMKSIIKEAAQLGTRGQQEVSEPELVVAIAERLSQSSRDESLFIANSMPVRDCEFFLYPFEDVNLHQPAVRVGTNRGASGIDGIIASATGFSESTQKPTTLLIGDLASIHDINSLHALANDSKRPSLISGKANPVTAIVVNNDGGGIFSFLPIAQHGSDVSFNEFFGTPTKTFSFKTGAQAFGLPVQSVTDLSAFRDALVRATVSNRHSLIEARVTSRDKNVEVHREITKSVNAFVTELLNSHATLQPRKQRLPVRSFSGTAEHPPASDPTKTFVLLHGWMGDKKEWDGVVSNLLNKLTPEWEILSVDLPGHGSAPFRLSSEIQSIRSALSLDDEADGELGLEDLAVSVLTTLADHYGVKHIHALAGYSLGGRVALAMKGLSELSPEDASLTKLIKSDTKLVLLSAYPGDITSFAESEGMSADEILRLTSDARWSSRINALCNKEILMHQGSSDTRDLWGRLLLQWYDAPIWGNLQKKRCFPDLMMKRCESVHTRGRDLAAVLHLSSPPRHKRQNWRLCSPIDTLFIAGSLDAKYADIGKRWSESAGVHFSIVPDAGHALLVEAPKLVSELLVEFVARNESVAEPSGPVDVAPEAVGVPIQLKQDTRRALGDRVLQAMPSVQCERSLGSVGFESFSIEFVDEERRQSPVLGMGWGESSAVNEPHKTSKRAGLILQLSSTTGLEVGIGEVSPLQGLHPETFEDALDQLLKIQESVAALLSPTFDAATFFDLNGEMKVYIEQLALQAGIDRLFPSVYTGLEMALLSLASQVVSQPVLAALERTLSDRPSRQFPKLLPINGLITRGSNEWSRTSSTAPALPRFPSIKVKVGHQSLVEDTLSMSRAFQRSGIYEGRPGGNIRADANRAWDESQAIEFASALDGIDLHSVDRLEFVEEPLKKLSPGSSLEAIETQIAALERWYMHTGIPYALDETLADLIFGDYEFDRIKENLVALFPGGSKRGCAAFVLKPALLGLEMSLRIAKLARMELGIGAVFSSSFDSGIGLAYTAILGSISDRSESEARTYPHGVGTYGLLAADTLNPPFASYVNELGMLNVASLSRALFGLSLDELNSLVEVDTKPLVDETAVLSETTEESYKASTATSSSGKEISVVVSLQLPFSADLACSRFTDLPQHSRWSPWITSVAYQGTETEWTLNVKGIPVNWRATSELLQNPPGIQWESVSGLSNRGRVEFLRETDSSCRMKVQMKILTPRLLRPLFMGTSIFLEDFLRDKLLKWSLEMFRDVVKADLALERGDVEFGDALYSVVEDKANAIKATLNGSQPINGEGQG